jgi:hypothetical protein
MATQTKSGNGTSFEEAAERVRDLNERIIEASRKAGKAYLDAYETSLKGVADYQQKVADATPVEWFSTLMNAQADFTREVAKAVTSSTRELLK